MSAFEPEPDIQFNHEKFRDLVHYVCSKTTPETMGHVKLHKILYLADMLRFTETGKPLTGEDYLKQQFGPTARHLKKAIDELEKTNALRVTERPFHGYSKRDFISLTKPAGNLLSEDELALTDKVMEFVCGKTANEISELSHNTTWEMAEPGERMPYYMAYALFPQGEITDEDREWATGEARRLNLI